MITPGTCHSYKSEILQGTHSSADTYKIALFRSSASLDPSATSYSGQSGEVVDGGGYSAGGIALSGFSVGLTDGTAFLSFLSPTWNNSSISARGALIYNSSKANRAVAVIDFGEDIASRNGAPFIIEFPTNDADHAFIALT